MRIATRRFHLRAEDIPANLRDPDMLLDLIVKNKNRAFKITQASQGDDMTTGKHVSSQSTLNPTEGAHYESTRHLQ